MLSVFGDSFMIKSFKKTLVEHDYIMCILLDRCLHIFLVVPILEYSRSSSVYTFVFHRDGDNRNIKGSTVLHGIKATAGLLLNLMCID